MEPPTTEAVYQGVYALYNNPDTREKEKASKWLEELQRSVYSWTIADELLQQKRDLHSCYFAAQTMRNKIQNSFHELPASAHDSLRNSLIAHIGQLTPETSNVIVTQLCLALADLALLMSSWTDPVLSLMEKFSTERNSIVPLIVIITLIPEEINSRYLRLGANRRQEIQKQLESNAQTVCDFLVACLNTVPTASADPEVVQRIIKCFTSWICVHAISMNQMADNAIVASAFQLLNNPVTDAKSHDVAADCLCALVTALEPNNNQHIVELQLFTGIVQLENAYHMSVAHEDVEKAMNFCRVFTVLTETFLDKIVGETVPGGEAHYAIKSLDLVLICVGHYDYEVAEITFNLWYKLSELLYEKNNDNLAAQFKPHIERLIGALFRHAQMEPDHEGIIDDSDAFNDFRMKVSDLIRDVVFIVGSSHCFKQMFLALQEPNVSWEGSESALFVMQNVAKNVIPEENDVVPKVVEAILNLPENTHMAVRNTSILLLGELCDWIERHPESLQAVLNFLLFSLQQKSGLALAAATALQSICAACKEHMKCHLAGLIQIASCLDSFEITNESAIGLLKGISIIVSRLPGDQLQGAIHEICSFQLLPLQQLVALEVNIDRGQRSDPTFWLDRLAAILRHTNPLFVADQNTTVHPCTLVFTCEMWPVISSVLAKHQNDLRIMERACRCIRYAIRCIGNQAAPLLDPLVKQIVGLYTTHTHSCYLYLGSILVDEFARDPVCRNGLLDMLQAVIEPTFTVLQQENGLKNNPDMVDDFFRLCARFIQRCPVEFLQSPCVAPIIQCALLACALDHRDANVSVMKFLSVLLNLGKAKKDVVESSVVQQAVRQIVHLNGKALVMNLLHASVFCLHTYMLGDVADVITELKSVDALELNNWMQSALDSLPTQNSGGCVNATTDQLHEFHLAVVRAESTKNITHALKDFTRLYR